MKVPAVAVTVNKFNQTTAANFISATPSKFVSRVGNVDIFSNSEADLLGVAIGGAGGEGAISAAGSNSFNYINNSARALVENQNVTAKKNFGVVAQSDDKSSNYAGAINVDVNGRGTIGVSVAYNTLTGNTDATVKNSILDVAGSDNDRIGITNPNENLIDGLRIEGIFAVFPSACANEDNLDVITFKFLVHNFFSFGAVGRLLNAHLFRVLEVGFLNDFVPRRNVKHCVAFSGTAVNVVLREHRLGACPPLKQLVAINYYGVSLGSLLATRCRCKFRIIERECFRGVYSVFFGVFVEIAAKFEDYFDLLF